MRAMHRGIIFDLMHGALPCHGADGVAGGRDFIV